jgi:hypothetical protein
MKTLINGINLLIVLSVLALNQGCGGCPEGSPVNPESPPAGPAEPPVGPGANDVVVRSRAYFTYDTSKEYAAIRQLRNLQGLFIPTAWAANPAPTNITVVNAANVTMTLNAAGFQAPPLVESELLAMCSWRQHEMHYGSFPNLHDWQAWCWILEHD